MTKPLVRTCVIGEKEYLTRCTNSKYCPVCRCDVIKQKHRERYRIKHAADKFIPKFTIYTCKRCGSHIKAHGVCTNRRICNNCLDKDPTSYGTQLRERRKENVEEVIL